MTERSDNTKVARHPRTYEVRKKGTQQLKPKLKARSLKEVEGAKAYEQLMEPTQKRKEALEKEIIKPALERTRLMNLSADKVINNTTKNRNRELKKKGYVRSLETDKNRKLQRQLYEAGFFGNISYEKAVDGDFGRMSQAALQKALEAGYVYKNGLLIKSEEKSKPTTSLEKPKLVSKNVSDDALKQVYLKGPGFIDAASAMLYHVLAPESSSMPHSEGLKDQIAAAILYSENTPDNLKEIDPVTKKRNNDDGSHYVGYNTYGILSGLNGNVNNLNTENNATSKVMGGLRYIKNPDGSVTVKDNYSFGVIRDFSKLNSQGKPVASTNVKADPYYGKPIRGLIHDLKLAHSNLFSMQGLLDIAENFGSRQGKVRDNGFTFAPGEIERRINQ